MRPPTWLSAVYFVTHEPMWGWVDDEKVEFRPRRIQVEIVVGEQTTINISGPQRYDSRAPWASVYFGGSYAPLHEAPVFALELLTKTKNLLNGG